jgi:hypothetical protein
LEELPDPEQKKALAKRFDELVKNSRNAAISLFKPKPDKPEPNM